ncbi:M4 family metallopeptidase [Streptomyces hiroshimensis]|uniref:Neutral metalloproteinase n=1 Tax=Streptomyces hiroshimensis TaxID=66424 RepID=A0ABQ2YPB4_9ACTN|nr:M4 family metallopeptidase [Streptomyces hiroshimensis]GGX88330.1 peptidase M4 [Streptomyces hiroshimensis]
MRRFTTPRSHTVRTTALLASAALCAVAVQTGVAGAQAESGPSAMAVRMTPDQRASEIRSAQDNAAATAGKIGLGAKEKLVVRDVVKDADGTVHTRYERTYAGLPVLGGDLVVHQDPSGRTSVTKSTEAALSLTSTDAAQPASAAAKAALSAASAQHTTKPSAGTPRKVVWASAGTPVLAYETVVEGVQPDGTPSELHVITDAGTGAELFRYEAIETGTGTSQYSGTVPLTTTKSGSSYQLNDSARGGHKTYDLKQGTSGTGTLYSNATDTWAGGRLTAGVDAHYGAAVTWDFYKNTFGRNGIRNDGKGAYSRAHYGNSYVNAFWNDSCFCMTYGDGSGNKKPLTAIDVAGHEMSHGVTAATAKLVYSGESGGLNEATSDIFGTAVEFYANNSSDVGDYLIGEKIDIFGNGKPLRYMDKPSKDGNSADNWSSGVGGKDVHYSSGVANHFFYLLSEGSGKKTINGVQYDSPTADGSKVTGIGRDKAAKIWYKALTSYMTSNTNYKAARTATLSAAGALYGTTSTEYKTVGAAWSAVNVK